MGTVLQINDEFRATAIKISGKFWGWKWCNELSGKLGSGEHQKNLVKEEKCWLDEP